MTKEEALKDLKYIYKTLYKNGRIEKDILEWLNVNTNDIFKSLNPVEPEPFTGIKEQNNTEEEHTNEKILKGEYYRVCPNCKNIELDCVCSDEVSVPTSR